MYACCEMLTRIIFCPVEVGSPIAATVLTGPVSLRGVGLQMYPCIQLCRWILGINQIGDQTRKARVFTLCTVSTDCRHKRVSSAFVVQKVNSENGVCKFEDLGWNH